MNVVLLHDALSAASRTDELDVLDQLRAIQQSLGELGHESTALSISLNLEKTKSELLEIKPDLVFNLVEAVQGTGRLIYLAPALLDWLGIPYVGASTEAMFLTSNKLMGKQRMVANDVISPPWFDPAKVEAAFVTGRYILKSVWEEASVGLDEDSVGWYVDQDSLRSELRRRAPSLGGCGFAEAFIDGREFNVGMLACDHGRSVEIMPVAEIEFVGYSADKPKVIGYRAKWIEDSYEYNHTPRRFHFPKSDEPLLERLRVLAKCCWDLFALSGWGRVDFRVDPAGKPYVLEINANPCLTPEAGFHSAALEAGIQYNRLIERILESAPNTSH